MASRTMIGSSPAALAVVMSASSVTTITPVRRTRRMPPSEWRRLPGVGRASSVGAAAGRDWLSFHPASSPIAPATVSRIRSQTT
jgi:hypothetical protein